MGSFSFWCFFPTATLPLDRPLDKLCQRAGNCVWFCELCNLGNWKNNIPPHTKHPRSAAQSPPTGNSTDLWLVRMPGGRRHRHGPGGFLIGRRCVTPTVAWWCTCSLSSARSSYWSCLLQWKHRRRWVDKRGPTFIISPKHWLSEYFIYSFFIGLG